MPVRLSAPSGPGLGVSAGIVGADFGSSTDVFVTWGRGDGVLGCRGFIEPGHQDGLNGFVSERVASFERPVAGRFGVLHQSGVASERRERTGIPAGMGPIPHEAFDQNGGVVPDARCPSDQALGVSSGIALMRLRHVLLDCRMPAALTPALVDGNAFVAVKYLNSSVG